MMNGEINGFHNSLIEEDCFLFTSESVGEGHPGKARHAGLLCFPHTAALYHCFKVICFPVSVSTRYDARRVFLLNKK